MASISKLMEKKPKKKKNYLKPPPKDCIYCGSKKIEHISVGHVGVIRICSNCKEQQ